MAEQLAFPMFEEQGPRQMASAVRDVGKAFTEVGSTVESTARRGESAIGALSSKVDALLAKLRQVNAAMPGQGGGTTTADAALASSGVGGNSGGGFLNAVRQAFNRPGGFGSGRGGGFGGGGTGFTPFGGNNGGDGSMPTGMSNVGFSGGRLALGAAIAGTAALDRATSGLVSTGMSARQMQFAMQTFRGGSLRSNQDFANQFARFTGGDWGQINSAYQMLQGLGGAPESVTGARMNQAGLMTMAGAANGTPISFTQAAQQQQMFGSTAGVIGLRSLHLAPQQFGGMRNVNPLSVAMAFSQEQAAQQAARGARGMVGAGGMLSAKALQSGGTATGLTNSLTNSKLFTPQEAVAARAMLSRMQQAGPQAVQAAEAASTGTATSAQTTALMKALGYSGTDAVKMLTGQGGMAAGTVGMATGAADAASTMQQAAGNFATSVAQFTQGIQQLVGGAGVFGGAASGVLGGAAAMTGHGLMSAALGRALGNRTGGGILGRLLGGAGPDAVAADTGGAGLAAAGLPLAAVLGSALGAALLSRPGHGTPGSAGAGGGGPLSLQNIYRHLGMHQSAGADIADWTKHAFGWMSGAAGNAGGPTTPTSAPATAPAGSGSGVISDAVKYLGVPYKWGGTNPSTGLDCSGFTQLVFKDQGVSLPRTSQEQAHVGQAVPNLAAARPGDLVFYGGGGYDGTPSSPGHVGIYAGGGKMIDAPHSGATVRYDAVGNPVAIRRVAGGNGTATASNTNGGTTVGGGTLTSVNAVVGEGSLMSEAAYLTSALTPTFGGGAVSNGRAASTGNGGTVAAGAGAGATAVGPAPAGSHIALIRQALGLAGVADTAANEAALNTIVTHESSWNPNAINRTDSNAKAGHPSQGLMQTIPGTFDQYRLPNLSNNINDPLSNLVAGIRYAIANYGSLDKVAQREVGGKGYAKGATFIEADEVTTVHKGEMIIPAARAAALHMNQMSDPSGPGGGINITFGPGSIVVQAGPGGSLPSTPDVDRFADQMVKAVRQRAERELLRTS